ncbi:MAG TPA: hypothetical protein VNX68_15975, partial [Nitrosopumilaceae archaeon]|nr:hypothetical protein [Nitrosopumilaceae archaeon]
MALIVPNLPVKHKFEDGSEYSFKLLTRDGSILEYVNKNNFDTTRCELVRLPNDTVVKEDP